MMVASLGRICGIRGTDHVYTTLPLYHSAGLLIGVGGCLEIGTYPTARVGGGRRDRDGWMDGEMGGEKEEEGERG